jgi:hypothetical protein
MNCILGAKANGGQLPGIGPGLTARFDRGFEVANTGRSERTIVLVGLMEKRGPFSIDPADQIHV